MLSADGVLLYDSPVNEQISRLINRDGEMAAYYRATDAKHFGNRESAGAKFSDKRLNRLEDVLALAIEQRGSLDGDDRATFIEMGTLKNSLDPDIRYLYVKTPGTYGVIYSEGMPDGIPLLVGRTKPSAPCSVIHSVQMRPTTSFAVIVIDKDAAGNERVITAHPGTPVKPKSGEFDAFEGQYITLGQARAIAGGELWIETSAVN